MPDPDPRLAPEHAILALRARAIALAGEPDDFARRAAHYTALYRHSGGNHAFALLAAHGALWGIGYLDRAVRVGHALAALHRDAPARRQRLTDFVEAFGEINRRVFVEFWFTYQLTADPALESEARRLLPTDLFMALTAAHVARRADTPLSETERRALFASFFHWEQTQVVAPLIDAAYRALSWPLVAALAARPRIAFAYMPRGTALGFHNFRNTTERLALGLRAFDTASKVGWPVAEAALAGYAGAPGTRTAPRTCLA